MHAGLGDHQQTLVGNQSRHHIRMYSFSTQPESDQLIQEGKPDRCGVTVRSLRLPEKLQLIRKSFGLSQNEMISRLGLTSELIREELSAFERGLRSTASRSPLGSARCVNISTDVLLDDEMDLPPRLQLAPPALSEARPALAENADNDRRAAAAIDCPKSAKP